MRFEIIRIERFGPIRDLDTGPETLPALVAVAGPNEAGKSTFFRFLTSILYGFSPASRELNPDTPWGDQDAEGWARIRTDDGDGLEVRRRLLSTPWGRLVRDGHEEDLRNAPLPLVTRLPRTVFRQVFALTLAEVAALEAGEWSEVQDRLVSAMGARDLVPPRDVVSTLEEEAGALWRPNRRGNQAVRQIGHEIREAEAAREDARRRDAEIRELVEDVDRLSRDLRALEDQRGDIQRTEERVGTLLPVHRQLERVRELEARAGDPTELRGLPADPRERLTGLRERVEALSGRLEDVDGLIRALDENRRRAEALAHELFGRAWTPSVREAVRQVAPGLLREGLREHHAARDALRLAEASLGAARPEPSPDGRVPVLLAGGGGTVLVVGLLSGIWSLVAAGAAALALAAWLFRSSGFRMPAAPGQSVGLDALRAAEATARRKLAAVVERLPLVPEVATDPTLELPALLQRLQELDRDLAGQAAKALELTPGPPPASPDPTPEDQLSLLEVLDGSAAPPPVEPEGTEGATAPASDGARGPVDPFPEAAARLAAAREDVWRQRGRAIAERRELESKLAALGDGDADRGAEAAARRLAARGAARELVRELEGDHPDLEELREEIGRAVDAGEVWTEDPHALTSLQRRRKELTRRIEEMGRDLERSRQALERLQELPTADQIDGRVLALRLRRAELARERDRLTVLAHVVREADRRFRAERQPRVLARAGEYLAHVTAGRYRELLTAREDGRDVFKLRGDAHPHPVSLERGVSTGAREQAYLALRLAAVEELDAGGERLPVFVDEVFVNWDAERRSRGLELLAQVAAQRQVFVFTCHGDIAAALEALGGTTVRMDQGRLRMLQAEAAR